ncbi:YigZ family protein [Candidatus Gracilibacteria bacterium]|nr:MAG: YigZ family protein [Candidatus Gracilibacteria bacterium]
MKRKILKDVIIDRKSKYTVLYNYIENKEDLQNFLKLIKSDSYFKKATHNSYAYRILQENGSVIEGKNDDGETGAGLCILREIQRVDFVNVVVVVTRFFGGIMLQSDRFKHVINATKIFMYSGFEANF